MITKVRLEHFKRFSTETFELEDDIVLAGPNNAGKTTLLQAVATWFLALQRWLSEHAESSKAKQRTGIPVSRNDFTAIPLREMNLIWFDRDTAFSKEEREGVNAGQPKLIAITLFGKAPGQTDWNLTVTLRYTNKEQIYVKLADESGNPVTDVPPQAREIKIVHVPPFSGIGAEETGLQLGYQNRLVGQGKPGDILRNLLLEVYRTAEKEKSEQWKALTEDVYRLFSYRLRNPQYSEAADPFIRIEYYTHRKPKTAFDVASAGSGFHQVLTLLGFFYARPASVLLLDEPDAHLHVILQRQVYDLLRSVARRRGCQLLISTHSEIILEDTGPEQILSFYGRPHRLAIQADRDQVREALKRLSSLDILAAENGQHVFYVEDETDFKMLSEFARILEHPFSRFAASPFVCPIHGRDAREAKAHFFGLKAIRPGIKGVLLLDGDNRNLPDREISADGLSILRWRRYEIENYLLCPEALLRFAAGSDPDLWAPARSKAGEEFLRENLPPLAFKDPLKDTDYLVATPASKSILPGFLEQADCRLPKKDYFQIVAQMKPEEIHPEVIEKLDLIASILNEGVMDE